LLHIRKKGQVDKLRREVVSNFLSLIFCSPCRPSGHRKSFWRRQHQLPKHQQKL